MDFHPKLDEGFLKGKPKAHEAVKMLQDMIDLYKTDVDRRVSQEGAEIPISTTDCFAKYDGNGSNVDEEDEKDENSPQKTYPFSKEEQKFKCVDEAWEKIKAKRTNPITFGKHTFMRLLDTDIEEHEQVVKERRDYAQKFRNLGNASYKAGNFESAIDSYTKAIEYVKDSHLLYNNRALAYIRTKQYYLGIHDCDHVLMELDDENLRSWMYRALAFKRLGDEKNWEWSVQQAYKFNFRDREYIEKFLHKMQFV